MMQKTWNNYLAGLCLLCLPLSAWSWSQCETQQQIVHNQLQAAVQTKGVAGGCSIVDIDVAIGPRHGSPLRLTLRGSDPLIHMEFTDLDRNRQPELVLITRNAGSGSYGGATLIINAGKELRPIALPDVDSKTHSGYRGHDRIFTYRDVLIREFPVYGEKDPNCCPTGELSTLIYSFDGQEFKLQP
ncbi:MAG: hypothetical protein R3312_10980 [Gammaproteobacteria bacterium]|nr:hypothetical protein [Gammaproteobacteria bacterium]